MPASVRLKPSTAEEDAPGASGVAAGSGSDGDSHEASVASLRWLPPLSFAGTPLPRWVTAGYLGLLGFLMLLLYGPFIRGCISAWRSEGSYYSHGFLIPIISVGLLWLRRGRLAAVAPHPSNWAFAFAAASLGFHFFANYVYMQTGVGLALVLMVIAVVLQLWGWEMVRLTLFPVLFLLFAVPMSPIFTEPISVPMRLVSTKLGAGLLAAAGVPARASGTFIQFPHFTLVVPNACSGMQSLVSLFAALAAFVYLVEGPRWKKAILLACIPPFVIFGNGVRLALTGLTAVGLTQKATSGTVHELTGLIVFAVACLGILVTAKVVLGLDTLNIDSTEDPGDDDPEAEPEEEQP
jgi:exosortase